MGIYGGVAGADRGVKSESAKMTRKDVEVGSVKEYNEYFLSSL